MLSEVERNKQFEVVRELSALRLIETDLAKEICTNIEEGYKLKRKRNSEDQMEIVQHAPVDYQLLVTNSNG